jgi:hypothetical protein
VPIKRSAGGDVKGLVEALAGGDVVTRESAIARLAIIGARAMERLIAAYAGASDDEARIAVLRAMESIGDRRSAPVAARALAAGGDVALAAASVLRVLLDTTHTPTATAALDALIATALDRGAERRLRLAAFDALQDVPGGVRDRIAAALDSDIETDRALQRAASAAPRAAAGADGLWDDAVAGRLPDDPAALRNALRRRAASAPLTALQKLIDALRAKESSLRPPARRTEWRALRGTLHQALAVRGSRVALYDLRETLADAGEPLPVSYLAAVHALGDASCLESLAAAYSRAQRSEAWWRHQLAAAFQTIVERERITKRHAVMKRIQKRWPAAAAEILRQ